MKSYIFQNEPDAIPVKILMDKVIWQACMKNASKTSPALCNGNRYGVGLGDQGADAHKRHVFYFDTTPILLAGFDNYPTTMSMNNLINHYFKLDNITLLYPN